MSARNSQLFEEEYKVTVVDKTLVSCVSKILTTLYQNEGVSVFHKMFTMKGITR